MWDCLQCGCRAIAASLAGCPVCRTERDMGKVSGGPTAVLNTGDPEPVEVPAEVPAAPVPVAVQRAAGVPPEQLVTVADQKAGVPPPDLSSTPTGPAEDRPGGAE